jgi:hypothetical protein
MPRFRPRSAPASPTSGPLSLEEIRGLVADAVRPGHFFVGPNTHLEWEHVAAEDVSWEVFRGRLLDPAHTRERRTFEAWNVYLISDGARSPEPLLSVKLDAAAGQVHVMRAIHCYAWEGYDAGDNVILSRETKKWVRELVGTIDLADYADADDLRDEIICRLFQAVVGSSRLPLTSVEAPLPAFTFGELGYFYRPDAAAEPMRSDRDLVELVRTEGTRELAKYLELLLHTTPADELPGAWPAFVRLSSGPGTWPFMMFAWMRHLFNEASLSPWTDLPQKALARACAVMERVGDEQDRADYADFLARLLRQIGRHLTAYDLVQFHHAGANYPDALLLDLVLRDFLDLIERHPGLFLDDPHGDEAASKAKRLRRRGLRQAWLIRNRYRGLLVPDVPTSHGENARVLPAPHARIPEEQILNPHRRSKQLFEDDLPASALADSVQAVLRQSVADLAHPHELRELGLALFLDRPLGAIKAPGEPDQTPLFSYEAFSSAVARQALLVLGRDSSLLSHEQLSSFRQALERLAIPGLPAAQLPAAQRPGVVSLADARKAAEDFIFLRTTESSLLALCRLFDFTPVCDRFHLTSVVRRGEGYLVPPGLIVGHAANDGSVEIVLTFYEPGTLRRRLELSAYPRDGYQVRAGVEYPRKGLRVRRVWEEVGGELRERDLRGEEVWVRPM